MCKINNKVFFILSSIKNSVKTYLIFQKNTILSLIKSSSNRTPTPFVIMFDLHVRAFSYLSSSKLVFSGIKEL